MGNNNNIFNCLYTFKLFLQWELGNTFHGVLAFMPKIMLIYRCFFLKKIQKYAEPCNNVMSHVRTANVLINLQIHHSIGIHSSLIPKQLKYFIRLFICWFWWKGNCDAVQAVIYLHKSNPMGINGILELFLDMWSKIGMGILDQKPHNTKEIILNHSFVGISKWKRKLGKVANSFISG